MAARRSRFVRPRQRPPGEGLVKFSHDMSSQQTKSGSNFNGGRARRLWGALPAREIGRARRGATGMFRHVAPCMAP